MTQETLMTRRTLLKSSLAISGLALSGCAVRYPTLGKVEEVPLKRDIGVQYAAMPNERFPIPAADLSKIPSKFYRRRVNFATDERPGTLIVNTRTFYLHLVEEGGTAMRYGCGLGRAGFEWSGKGRIAWKQEWPKWTPPDEMIERQPELAKYSAENGGMKPGLKNPLGSRALYIFEGKQDTLYRVHGTPEYWTIGKAVSSGCVRMVNQDVIDLYNRVKTNVPILVV